MSGGSLAKIFVNILKGALAYKRPFLSYVKGFCEGSGNLGEYFLSRQK